MLKKHNLIQSDEEKKTYNLEISSQIHTKHSVYSLMYTHSKYFYDKDVNVIKIHKICMRMENRLKKICHK